MNPWRHVAEDLRAAKASGLLALALLLIQLGMERAGSPDAVFRVFGLSREGLAAGRIWQVPSYAVLHGGWIHAGLNACLLWTMGARLERIGGWRTLARVLGAGVVAGALGHLAVAPGSKVLVGVSGGVVAMLMWLTSVSPESRMWPLPLSGRSLGLGILLASGMLTLVDPELGLPGLAQLGCWLSAKLPGTFAVSHACHLAGGMAGWVLARWTLRPRVTLAGLRAERARREGG